MWPLILFAVPVLYLLSVPVVSAFVAACGIWTPTAPPPKWLRYYTVPYYVVRDNTAMKGMMDAYDVWCWRQAGPLP